MNLGLNHGTGFLIGKLGLPLTSRVEVSMGIIHAKHLTPSLAPSRHWGMAVGPNPFPAYLCHGCCFPLVEQRHAPSGRDMSRCSHLLNRVLLKYRLFVISQKWFPTQESTAF